MLTESELIINPNGTVYHLGIAPHQVAPLIIAVGDPDRVPLISQYFDNIDYQNNCREFVTHTGSIKGQSITVISSGMGTDNIEILMTELDILFNYDLTTRQRKPKHQSFTLVRVGTSGALQPDLPLDSFIVSEKAIGLDTLGAFYNIHSNKQQKDLLTAFREHTNLSFMPYTAAASAPLLKKFDGWAKGITLTCPGFYAPQGRVIQPVSLRANLVESYQSFNYQNQRVTNLEMETAGYYAFGQMLNHHVLSVSALLANRSNGQFSQTPRETVEKLIREVLQVLT